MFSLIHGVNTHYQVIGKGFPLVLLHGWGCTWEIWSPIIPNLSEKYQLIIPDLPGFGRSDDPEKIWDTLDYAQWLDQLISTTLGRKKYNLLGHSFGGKIAAVFAAKEFEVKKQLNKLIIVDASGLPLKLTAKEQFVRSVSQLLPGFVKEKIGKRLKTKILEKTGVASDYQQANTYQQAVLKKIVRENIRHDLKKIPTKTLIIWGAQDEATPLHKGKEFSVLIPKATLAVMEHSGHYPFINETEKFIETVQGYL